RAGRTWLGGRTLTELGARSRPSHGVALDRVEVFSEDADHITGLPAGRTDARQEGSFGPRTPRLPDVHHPGAGARRHILVRDARHVAHRPRPAVLPLVSDR